MALLTIVAFKTKVEVVETRDECKSTKEKLQWSRLV